MTFFRSSLGSLNLDHIRQFGLWMASPLKEKCPPLAPILFPEKLRLWSCFRRLFILNVHARSLIAQSQTMKKEPEWPPPKTNGTSFIKAREGKSRNGMQSCGWRNSIPMENSIACSYDVSCLSKQLHWENDIWAKLGRNQSLGVCLALFVDTFVHVLSVYPDII